VISWGISNPPKERGLTGRSFLGVLAGTILITALVNKLEEPREPEFRLNVYTHEINPSSPDKAPISPEIIISRGEAIYFHAHIVDSLGVTEHILSLNNEPIKRSLDTFVLSSSHSKGSIRTDDKNYNFRKGENILTYTFTEKSGKEYSSNAIVNVRD